MRERMGQKNSYEIMVPKVQVVELLPATWEIWIEFWTSLSPAPTLAIMGICIMSQ